MTGIDRTGFGGGGQSTFFSGGGGGGGGGSFFTGGGGGGGSFFFGGGGGGVSFLISTLLIQPHPLQINFCLIFSGLQHTTLITTKFSFSLYTWSCISHVHKNQKHQPHNNSGFFFLFLDT
jgi:hypothetical protein